MNLEVQAQRKRLTWGRVALVIYAALALSYLVLWGMAYAQELTWRADFTMLYTGGALVRDGHGAQLYDLDLQTRYQQRILAGRSFRDGLLPFNYPPYVALLLSPLTRLPLTTAYGVWMLLQTGLLGWLLRRLWQITSSWPHQERMTCLVTILAFTPLLNTLLLGSFSLLLLVSWVEGYVQLKAFRERRAGLWLALGALKPQSVVAFGVATLGARRWRVLAAVVMIGSAVFISTTLLLGFPIWPDFAAVLAKVSQLYDAMGIVLLDMHNFKAVLAGVLGPGRMNLINGLSWAAFAGVMLWTLWAWRGPWRPGTPDFDLRLAVTCALGLFFSPHLYPQDSLLWVFPAFLGYAYLRERRLPRTAYTVFLLNWPWVFLLDEFAPWRLASIRPAVLVTAALLLWLCVLLWRSTPKEPA